MKYSFTHEDFLLVVAYIFFAPPPVICLLSGLLIPDILSHKRCMILQHKVEYFGTENENLFTDVHVLLPSLPLICTGSVKSKRDEDSSMIVTVSGKSVSLGCGFKGRLIKWTKGNTVPMPSLMLTAWNPILHHVLAISFTSFSCSFSIYLNPIPHVMPAFHPPSHTHFHSFS